MSARACFSGNSKSVFAAMDYTSSCHSRVMVYTIQGDMVLLVILRIGNADLVASDGWMVDEL